MFRLPAGEVIRGCPIAAAAGLIAANFSMKLERLMHGKLHKKH